MEMTREIMFEQFAKLKTKDEKVKYLIDLKEMKQKTPHVFRNIKISIKPKVCNFFFISYLLINY